MLFMLSIVLGKVHYKLRPLPVNNGLSNESCLCGMEPKHFGVWDEQENYAKSCRRAGVRPKSSIYKINNMKRSDRFSQILAETERHTFRIDRTLDWTLDSGLWTMRYTYDRNIFGKPSAIFGKLRKMVKYVRMTFGRSSKNARKSSENHQISIFFLILLNVL